MRWITAAGSHRHGRLDVIVDEVFDVLLATAGVGGGFAFVEHVLFEVGE